MEERAPLTFRALAENTMIKMETVEASGYHYENQSIPSPKRHKPNSGKGVPCEYEHDYNVLVLSSGRVLRFFDTDGYNLLVPTWLQPNMYVRKIISKLPRSIRKRMTYLEKFMNEEDAYDDEENELYYHLRDQVYDTYILEMRLRERMRAFVRRWRQRRMDRRADDNIDPITQCPPEKEVEIYDWDMKKKYVFDAKSLAIHIETQLSHHDSGFANPQCPRNPWTNVNFSYNQLLSIYFQLKHYRELRWGLTTLYEYEFDKKMWHRYHVSAITMKAIKNSLTTLDSMPARELLEDFILSQLSQMGVEITESITMAYRIIMQREPRHWYIELWKEVAMTNHESAHFGVNCNNLIREQCRKIAAKHHLFIKDLIRKGYVAR
jgi:hypothetical protein